jgi:hypothetical protein
MRFIASVDNRPLERCLEPDLFLEEVRSLADLKGNRVRLRVGSFTAPVYTCRVTKCDVINEASRPNGYERSTR